MTGNETRFNLRRYAPIGLYLAGLAALAAIVLFIIQQTFSLPVQISLGVIVLGLASFVLMDPQSARQALTGRQARYGSNAILMAVAFIGIVVVINYLVNNNSQQWDLTEDKTNTLADETISTLESLPSPVKADAYYTIQMPVESTRQLLQNYKLQSNGKFDFEFIDPTTNPIQAQQDKITRDGTIVLKMDGRAEQVSFASEEEITSALIRLANPGTRSVYFLTGHGEFTIDGSGENSYRQVRSALEAKNYTVDTLNLLATPKIPDDALAIIVAGSTKPLSQAEIDLIRAYQEKGGALIYLAEPRPATQFGDQADPMEDYLKETWGITLQDDVVIDPSSTQPVVAVSQRFTQHAITRKMYSLVLILPVARSVHADQDAPGDVQLTELAFSSDLAWGETDYEVIDQGDVKPDEGKDVLGPVPLAVAGINNNTSARILVVGDADFAGNNAYAQYGNSDFILNSIDWAAEQENLISLTPRTPTQRFIIPPDRTTMGLILFGSVFLLPGLVILTGITVWLQRRRRG